MLDVADNIDEEKAAHRFAGAFLLPAETLKTEVGEARVRITLPELLILKRKYGFSIAATIHRLQDLDIINASHCKQWWIKLRTLKIHKEEPEMLKKEEKTTWVEQNVMRAVSEGVITSDEAAVTYGFQVSPENLYAPLAERRALLDLPIEERRKILAAQSAAAKYETMNDIDLEWQGGDIVE